VTPKAVPLRDLLVTTKDGDWGNAEPADGSVPYRVVRGTDFAKARLGDISSVPIRYLSEKTAARRTLMPNDILIETAGGTSKRPTGRTLLVTERLHHLLGGPATCASFARFLRVDPKLADPAYVFWYLQELYRKGEMARHEVRHTGVGRFQYTDFAASEFVPLPPLTQQREIAAALCALDEKAANNATVIDHIGSLLSARFRLLLESKTPSYLPFDEVVERLKVTHKHSGKTVSSTGKVVVLDQSEDGVLGYHDGNAEFIAPATRPLCLFGDHTCSWRLGIGKFDVGPNVIPVTTKLSSDVSPIWLYFALEGVQQFQSYRRHWMELKVHSIPWLSDSDQSAFLDFATPALEYRTQLAKESGALLSLRDALMPNLLTDNVPPE